MVISSIIIDGYNLIGTQHRNLQKQREELIRQLVAYKKLKGHEITLVFDGWKSGSHLQEQNVIGGVRVIYSRLGDKADEVIKTIIEQDRKEWLVISSDRVIMDHARSCGSLPVSSDQFLELLDQVGKQISGDYEPLDDDEKPQKGNPRQLSKKDKALARALKKLRC